MAGPPNSILAINSLDRFSRQNQTIENSLAAQYFSEGQPCNNFTLQSGGAFIYGYMEKMVVSAVQLQYNIPTIVPSVRPGDQQVTNSSTAGNDTLIIAYRWLSTPPDTYSTAFSYIYIPFGFYTPRELAAILEAVIDADELGTLSSNFTVKYYNNNGQEGPGGFEFDVGENDNELTIWFPAPQSFIGFDLPVYTRAYNRCLRLLGMTFNNDDLAQVGREKQYSSSTIDFLYTPYIDIISETLTKFQNIKDTDTSPNKLNSIIARIYLAGGGGAQPLTATGTPLGAIPFTIVQDLNTPKIIRWSPQEAVYNIDFQLRDSYGDLIFVNAVFIPGGEQPTVVYQYNTEFQMTLLCSESE